MERKKRPMRFLPIGIDVRGKNIIMFGGGNVALQKLKTIIMFGPKVTVYAPVILPEIKALKVKCIIKEYHPDLIKNAVLVYACTSDKDTNRVIGKDALAKGILSNTADDCDSCHFISPAVLKAHGLIITFDSQGNAPHESKRIRDYIRKQLKKNM